MATNVTIRTETVYGGASNPTKIKTAFGNGVPAGDAVLDSDTDYPIGSQYTDLATGKIWTKTAAATWTDSSAA